MAKAEHERRLAALEAKREARKPHKVGGLVLTEELALEIVAGSAAMLAPDTLTPERAVAAYARGGIDALEALSAEVATDASFRIGFVESMGLMMLPGSATL
jgi:hypothetical protein